ncbi:MAG: hypothetical protein Q7O66_03615 [Dehalococcoidia bacterium]|nr:hypothetical protein [Dehalococcoidia bacterium]
MLEPEDNLALCLARGGEEQPFMISETEHDFSIGWNSNYRIDGHVFIVITNDGQVRTIIGYPTQEILRKK